MEHSHPTTCRRLHCRHKKLVPFFTQTYANEPAPLLPHQKPAVKRLPRYPDTDVALRASEGLPVETRAINYLKLNGGGLKYMATLHLAGVTSGLVSRSTSVSISPRSARYRQTGFDNEDIKLSSLLGEFLVRTHTANMPIYLTSKDMQGISSPILQGMTFDA